MGKIFSTSAKESLTRTGHHCRVQRSDVRTVLRVSGNGGVYTCPKTEDKQISSECMIVWTKSNAVELALNLSQCESHFGLVRNFKGDTAAQGIRFARQDFPAAFTKLRPHDELPNIVSRNHFFRVEPTLVGTTSEQVQAWIDSHGWKAKPVRSVNAAAWPCVAEKRFDDTFPQWNNQPAPVKWVQQRPRWQCTEDHAVFPEGSPKSCKYANGSKGATPGGSLVQPPRKIEAPIEDKFQRQGEQMQHMRDVTEREIKALQGSMQKLENLKTKKV